jgi:hypothetical protein
MPGLCIVQTAVHKWHCDSVFLKSGTPNLRLSTDSELMNVRTDRYQLQVTLTGYVSTYNATGVSPTRTLRLNSRITQSRHSNTKLNAILVTLSRCSETAVLMSLALTTQAFMLLESRNIDPSKYSDSESYAVA